MERAVAVKKLSKIFGKQFAYEVKQNAPSAEEKAAAQAAAPAIRAEREAAGKALQARMEHLLSNDAEYQQLRERVDRARKAGDENLGILGVHKITVGTANSMFFHVEAQGESWEEIFEILKKKMKPEVLARGGIR